MMLCDLKEAPCILSSTQLQDVEGSEDVSSLLSSSRDQYVTRSIRHVISMSRDQYIK